MTSQGREARQCMDPYGVVGRILVVSLLSPSANPIAPWLGQKPASPSTVWLTTVAKQQTVELHTVEMYE